MEWGVQWGQWVNTYDGPFARVPVDEPDMKWEAAERSGELGRQAAARWAGERLGISAPAHLWHIFHPSEPGALDGEEVPALLIPHHRDLQPLASDTVSFRDGERHLPPKLVRQIDGIMENREEEESQPTSWRGAGWPKGKAKSKSKAKAKSTPKGKPKAKGIARHPKPVTHEGSGPVPPPPPLGVQFGKDNTVWREAARVYLVEGAPAPSTQSARQTAWRQWSSFASAVEGRSIWTPLCHPRI